MKEILKINQLTKHFGRITAVNNLNMEVEEGQVFGILGPNGSGKTTTLSVIMGVVSQQSGSFSWFGNDKDDNRWKRKVGSLIEAPNFYPYLSLLNNLKITAHIKSVPSAHIERVLRISGLYKRRHSPYRTLSLGMKQRLAVAAVLLGDPEVMVLDEPTNGLDPEGIAEVRNIIQDEAEKGRTVILASHILAEVEKVCTHVAVLKAGELIASGRVSELIGAEKVFLVSAPDIQKLGKCLSDSEMVNSISRQGDDILVRCTPETDAGSLNRFAFSHDIILSRLEPVKKSLESQFLELVR